MVTKIAKTSWGKLLKMYYNLNNLSKYLSLFCWEKQFSVSKSDSIIVYTNNTYSLLAVIVWKNSWR